MLLFHKELGLCACLELEDLQKAAVQSMQSASRQVDQGELRAMTWSSTAPLLSPTESSQVLCSQLSSSPSFSFAIVVVIRQCRFRHGHCHRNRFFCQVEAKLTAQTQTAVCQIRCLAEQHVSRQGRLPPKSVMRVPRRHQSSASGCHLSVDDWQTLGDLDMIDALQRVFQLKL